jgi:hypothetical protein
MVRSLWLVLFTSCCQGGFLDKLFNRSDDESVSATGSDEGGSYYSLEDEENPEGVSDAEEGDVEGVEQSDESDEIGPINSGQGDEEPEGFPPIEPLDETVDQESIEEDSSEARPQQSQKQQRAPVTPLPADETNLAAVVQPVEASAGRYLLNTANVDPTRYQPPQWNPEGGYHPYQKKYKHIHQNHSCHKKHGCRKHCTWCPKMNKYVCHKSHLAKILGLSIGIPGGIFIFTVWILFCMVLLWLILFGGLATLGLGKHGKKKKKQNNANSNHYENVPDYPNNPPIVTFYPSPPGSEASSRGRERVPRPAPVPSPAFVTRQAPFPAPFPAGIQMTEQLLPPPSLPH